MMDFDGDGLSGWGYWGITLGGADVGCREGLGDVRGFSRTFSGWRD